MSKFRTHYENLQVLESASIEVIRGAYKHLSQKWHPDKHPNNRERAERVIKIINSAYFVLSNLERRKDYDASILEQRKRATKIPDGKAESTENSTRKKTNSGRSGSTSGSKAKSKRSPHPWRRFLARNIDLFTSGLLVYFLVLSVINNFFPAVAIQLSQALDNELVAGFMVYVLWLPIEATFLCTLGTTPAKWIFGIFIKKVDGSNLSFSNAIYRAFLIFSKGEWLGIPFFKLIPNYFYYQKLNASGKTSWDAETGSIVTHKKWGIFRGLSAIVVTFLTIILFSILNQAGNQNKTHSSNSSDNLVLNEQHKIKNSFNQSSPMITQIEKSKPPIRKNATRIENNKIDIVGKSKKQYVKVCKNIELKRTEYSAVYIQWKGTPQLQNNNSFDINNVRIGFYNNSGYLSTIPNSYKYGSVPAKSSLSLNKGPSHITANTIYADKQVCSYRYNADA